MMRKSKNTKKEIESVGEEYGGHQVNTRVVYFGDGGKEIHGVLKFFGHLRLMDDTVYAIVETDERCTCTDTNGILGRLTKKELKKLNISSFYRTLVVRPEELMKEEFMYEQKKKEIVNHDLKNEFKETAQRQAIVANEPNTLHEVTERLSDLDFCYELNLTAPIYTEYSKPDEMVKKPIPRPRQRPHIASYDLFGERTSYEEISDIPILNPGFILPWSSSSESATNLQPIDFDEGNDAMSDGNDSMVVEVEYDDTFNEAPASWSDQPDHHSVNRFSIASNEPFTNETIIAPLKVPAVWSDQSDHHSANGFNIASNEPFTNETSIAPLKVPASWSDQPDHHSANGNGFNIASNEPFTNETIIAPLKVPAVWSDQPDHHSANGFNIASNEPFTHETIIAPLKVPAVWSPCGSECPA
ncbi:uncharacterized protein [Clytia hemisphaerica]|uniref:uncharacterized protein n=1 Tax=Clytia hemisphaerica TaxID=252671 RepID=UPI0034D6FE8C